MAMIVVQLVQLVSTNSTSTQSDQDAEAKAIHIKKYKITHAYESVADDELKGGMEGNATHMEQTIRTLGEQRCSPREFSSSTSLVSLVNAAPAPKAQAHALLHLLPRAVFANARSRTLTSGRVASASFAATHRAVFARHLSLLRRSVVCDVTGGRPEAADGSLAFGDVGYFARNTLKILRGDASALLALFWTGDTLFAIFRASGVCAKRNAATDGGRVVPRRREGEQRRGL